MTAKDFCKLREQIESAFVSMEEIEDEPQCMSVVYVPFASDGTILSVAKQIPFEPLDISFRTYDIEMVMKLSLNPVRTYRGDLNSLFDALNSKYYD